MKMKIIAFGKTQQDSNVKDIYFDGKVIYRSQKTYSQQHKQIKVIYSDILMNTYVIKPEMLSPPLKINRTILVSYHQK